MPVRRFDPTRAVEIISEASSPTPTYGTGYRIGGRLVLTAAHLLPVDPGSLYKVRSRNESGKVEWEVADARVAWRAPEADAALVELPKNVEGVESAVLGRLPVRLGAAKVQFDMYGWPEWALTLYKDSKKAGGRHVPGEIFLADRSAEGFIVLEPARLPGVAMPGQKGSQWQGISGAAVVCDGLVVAVQRSHQRPDRPNSLDAEPLAKFFDDEDFRRLLAEHGIPLSFPEVHISEATHGPEPPLELASFPANVRNQFDFRTRAVPFVGRKAELKRLDRFLKADSPLLWWLVTGLAGSGKSRLAFEFCDQVKSAWCAGFLRNANVFHHWQEWRPDQPTLMVIDYAHARGQEVREIIESLYDRIESFSVPVRLLLLDRSGGSWLRYLYGEGSGRLKVESSQYDDSPLEVGPLPPEQQWKILSGLLRRWGVKERPNKECTLADLQQVDSHGRPLLVALAAHSLSTGCSITLISKEQLIKRFLGREEEMYWVPAGVTERDKNLLALVTMISRKSASRAELSLQQMLGDLSVQLLREYLPEFAPGGAEQDMARHNVMVGIESPGMLRPLKPGLLGEYFVLEHVKPSVDPRGSRAQMLCSEAWRLDKVSFAGFIHRATSDFPDHPGVDVLDRTWGDSPEDWHVWAAKFFFQMGDLAEQGKFERILRDYRQILQIARQRVEPDPFGRDAEGWLPLIVPDLVMHLVEADRRAEAEQAYEEYLRFLREARPEEENDWVLAKAERTLVVSGCYVNDPSPFERLWPRLLERAKAPSQTVVASAAWAAHDFIVTFWDREKNSALTAFRSVAALLEVNRGAAAEETDLEGYREVPLRCANHILTSCWKHNDFDSCITTFLDAVRHLPVILPKAEPDSSMPPLETVLEDLARKGQVLADYLVEQKRPQDAAQVLDSLCQLLGSLPEREEVSLGFSVASAKAFDVAVEAGNLDLALRIHERMAEALQTWPNDESLRKGTAWGCTILVAHFAYKRRFDAAISLLNQLWMMVQDSVSSGNEADRNKILYASFYLAATQHEAGHKEEAKKTLNRALSGPLRESLLYLRKEFDPEQVDGLLEELGLAQSNREDLDES